MIYMISFLNPQVEKRHHTQLGTEFKVTRLHLYQLNSSVFVEGIKASIKCVQLIWQHGLAHDGGTPAIVASDI